MKRRLLINRILALLVCGVMCVSCVMPAAAAPTEAEKTAEIHLSEVKGNVMVINGSGKEIPYAADMVPENGDHVKTREGSYLWMDLGNGNTAKMDARSGVEFRTSGSKKELLLDEGSLYFNLQEEDMNIRTMTAALNVQNVCGWIKAVDREHSLICILSGEGACSVTDPVSGQVKSEALNSGDLAECLVYPQDHEGDKCDIILRRFEEDDVAGFVLAELAEEPMLLEQISEASDVDLSSQAEDAQSRLQEEENGMQQKLDELNEKLEKQENNIAKEPTWEGDMEKEEEEEEKEKDTAAVQIPFPVPGEELTLGEEILALLPSASPAVPSPESYNEPEPGQEESVSAPSEPVANPGSASAGPDNSLVVKGISKNSGYVRVGKDGQIVFKNTFTNTTSSSWIENEGQITFEGNLNNEAWAYITNKAQIIAKNDIYNYDHARISNRGEIRAEQNVYNGLENDRGCVISNDELGQFDVAGKYVNGNARFSMSGGTISEFELRDVGANVKIYDASISSYIQVDGVCSFYGGKINNCSQVDGGKVQLSGGTISNVIQTGGSVDINNDGMTTVSLSYDDAKATNDISDSVTVKNGYVITGGSLDMSAGTLEAGTSDAALTVDIRGSAGGVSISGGTMFGNGIGKAAISAVSGNITIGSGLVVTALSDEDTDGSSAASAHAGDGGSPYGPVAIKAYNIFDTIRSDGNKWKAVMYPGNHLNTQYEADCNSPVYVGREKDGLVYLGCVSNRFPTAAEYADHGDIITLKEDVYTAGSSKAKKGSEVTLDLNGKYLGTDICFEGCSWVINGEGEAKEPGSINGHIENKNGNVKITYSILEGAVRNEGGGFTIDNRGLEGKSSVWFDIDSGSLDLRGGSYQYINYAGNSSIILIKGGNLDLRDGVRLEGVTTDSNSATPITIGADKETRVTIGSADIDGVGCPALKTEDGEGAITLSVEKGANISSEGNRGTIIFSWREGKDRLNLSGGKISNKFHELYGNSERTAPALYLMKDDADIPDCLSEIHTELVAEVREDVKTGIVAVIGNEAFETVWNGSCWELKLVSAPAGREAVESSFMEEQTDLPEDEEITEQETDDTEQEADEALETENPDESKDPEDEEKSDENTDGSTEPEGTGGSDGPKEPAEGNGSDGNPDDRETPPGGDDVLPPENAGHKKEEESAGDEGAGKEGEGAEERSE